MKISEVFYSIQGEGPQTGMPAWFIRTSGCNLTCDFCDTKYADKGTEQTIKNIIKKVNTNQCKNVVITGGEPMLQKDLFDLVQELINNNFKIYIETNGTIYNQRLIGLAEFIVSPKPQFMNDKYLKTLKQWSHQSVFKFVIETVSEFDRARTLCEQIDKFDNVYFMPKCTTKKEHEKKLEGLVNLVKDIAPWGYVSPRLHIYLWGSKRGV